MEELLALIGVCTLPLSVGLGVAWWHARREVRWLRAEWRAAAAPAGDRPGEHLHRLAQAVDAIALEVERISEGQRFTTTLLADRAAADRALGRPAAEHMTPH